MWAKWVKHLTIDCDKGEKKRVCNGIKKSLMIFEKGEGESLADVKWIKDCYRYIQR